jgi:hypothetical protein
MQVSVDRVRRIGVLIGYAEDDPETKARLAALRQGLEKRGWSEGRNVQIETRFAAGSADKYVSLAKELIATRPDVILAHTTLVCTSQCRLETKTNDIAWQDCKWALKYTVDVSNYPDDAPVPSFGPRLRCTRCGHPGADARPQGPCSVACRPREYRT